MTHIIAPTRRIIRRPTPLQLIVRAQPQHCPIGALSSTVRGPLCTCKQAPFFSPRLADDVCSPSRTDLSRPM